MTPRRFFHPHIYNYLQSIRTIGFAILLTVGCTVIPIQEMSDARQAIKSARDVEANQHVPVDLANAEQYLTLAEKSLHEGDLRQARHHALLAKEHAVRTHQIATLILRTQTVWQTIETLDPSLVEGKDWLMKMKTAAQQNHLEAVQTLAEQADLQGRFVLNWAYLNRANDLINQAKKHLTMLTTTEQEMLQAAEHAYFQCEGQRAYELMQSILPHSD